MSTIIRRLPNESNVSAALELCGKLELSVRLPVNMGYLSRTFDSILDGMLLALKTCPPPVQEKCSKILGLMGYINRMGFNSYEQFIMHNYRNNKRLQKYLILALQETLSCDTNCELHMHTEKLMRLLKDLLEGAENAENFTSISTCLVQFANNYRNVFERHFTDVVDIIIGWQLELAQPQSLRTHCYHVLEKLTPYFAKKLDFGFGLLTQFVEDITALDRSERLGERVAAFVGAFNSLFKCLNRLHINCESIVAMALNHLVEIMPLLLQLKDMQEQDHEALHNINELLCLCLLNNYALPTANTLGQLLPLQLEQLQQFSKQLQRSCLYLLYVTVRKLRAKLPAALVPYIFQGPDKSQSMWLAALRLRSTEPAHKLLLRTCQETLLIKNVPLLQQAYKQLVLDVNECVEQLAAEEQQQHASYEASLLLIFHMSALCALAKQTSSIIGMYACKPAILELLIGNCRAADLALWSGHADTHNAILQLLVQHCQANHNFRNNSSLLRERDSNSPTALSFARILQFLAQCLQQAAQLAAPNLKLLLNWTQGLLLSCQPCAAVLLQQADFLSICSSIAGQTAQLAPLECAGCIQQVLDFGSATLGEDLLLLYHKTALEQAQQLNARVQLTYGKLYAQLPLHLSIIRSMPQLRLHGRLSALNQSCTVQENTFRDFFEQLQAPEQRAFNDCLPGLYQRISAQLPAAEREQRSQLLASAWLQFEAARFCVNQKLRTPLGKPQETFLAFEAIIMRYARWLSGCAKSPECEALNELSLQQLCNIRSNLSVLLGFLDALEKLIYNAAEGSAFALRVPDKPVAAFFRLNNPTCQSWFNRIRMHVIVIAMHCQQPELVIRYAQQILLTQKLQESCCSQALVYLAWAYVCCSEADSLRGLLEWPRVKNDKCYQWLQYAAEQAAGRREQAAAGYKMLLDKEKSKDRESEEQQLLEPQTRQFVVAMLVECLQSTGQWQQLLQLKREEQANGGGGYNAFLQQQSGELNALEQLLSQREQQQQPQLSAQLLQLTQWPEPAGQASFSNCYAREQLDKRLLQQLQAPTAAAASSTQQLLHANWQESLLQASCSQQLWQQLMLLKYIAQHVQQPRTAQLELLPLSSSNRFELSSALLMRCLNWTQLLQSTHCSNETLMQLYLDTAAMAREEGNQQTSQSMLQLYFGQSLPQLTQQLLSQQLQPKALHAYGELAKCLHAQQLQCLELSSINVCAALCLSWQQQPAAAADVNISADLLLMLSEWISARSNSGLGTKLSPMLQQLLEQLPACPLTSSDTQPINLAHGERLVLRLINASMQQRPHNEAALLAYGNWCYRWGKKIVDSGCVLSATAVQSIERKLKLSLTEEQLQQLQQALSLDSSQCEGEGVAVESDAHCEQRLRALSWLQQQPTCLLECIVQLGRQANAHSFDYYRQAARAYFQYLSLKSSESSELAHSNLVTTTLRLLRLIVKHAGGLQEVLQQGLQTTPIGPWKVIIPQLFSRLNHHEPYVRQSVRALLCRLAQRYPQLVTFPAVVGANRELQALPVGATEAESNSYACLLQDLSKQAPELVQHVQLLVKELRRVCLLWDEYWLHAMAQIYNGYAARVAMLSSEFAPSNLLGKQQRFDSWRPQILKDLLAVNAFTSRAPETSYERNFKRRFDSCIQQTLHAMQSSAYPACWEQLKQLYNVLQHNLMRGSSNTLRTQGISPVLCELKHMRISMPGLDASGAAQPVLIERVDNLVCILLTKTKPKKIAFYGSNGQRYTFLFKGLEDLHLDERIMQFLAISNAIMANKEDARAAGQLSIDYRAHHYSVIPLGPQSGLISWVDGLTPLFALYKKWQQRQPQSTAPAAARRLTDLYYNKLSPLLAKHNLHVSDPRRQWPLAALRQVLSELTHETPGELLTRELWLQATNAAEWRHSVRCYTMCMSVMSVIGYVIGLGDRHLDNMLINLSSGHIMHIDYNVCFEKGRTLRIPERVPFRLTQNLINAFGITGIEGAFRYGCEYVLKVMRKERETLLTLLEAFVYDPLVDWTVNDETAAMRRAIQAKPTPAVAEVSSELKCSNSSKKDKAKCKLQDWDSKRRHLLGKLKQCQKYWNKYKTDILAQLTAMLMEIKQLQSMQEQRGGKEQQLVELNQRSALIAEIKTLGTAMESHSFNSASKRFATKQQHAQALAELAVQSAADYEVVRATLNNYHRAVEQQQLAQFNASLLQFKLEGSSSWHNEYLALRDVLQLHLAAATLESYESTRSQIDEQLAQLHNLGLQAVEQLLQYAAIMCYYPQQRQQQQNIYMQFSECYTQQVATPSATIVTGEQARATASCLQSVWLQLNCQLHQLTQQFANDQLLTQTQTPAASLLAGLQQSGCTQAQLHTALARSLDASTSVLSSYELAAVQDAKLTQLQLRHIQLVHSMCQGLLQSQLPEQSQQTLSQLQAPLAALLQLQHCFEHELPASMFRLLANWEQLQELLKLDAAALGELFATAAAAAKTPTQLTLLQQFMLSLQPARTQFDALAKALEQLARSIKLSMDETQQARSQPCQDLGILKYSSAELSDAMFFGLVRQTLRAARSCDVRLMARPVQSFVQRMQQKYLVGVVPCVAYAFYSSSSSSSQQLELSSSECPAEIYQMTAALMAALQSDAMLQQQQCDIALLNQQIELLTLVATAHYWAHEEALTLEGGGELNCAHILSRQKVCEAIGESWQLLEQGVQRLEHLQCLLATQLEQLQQQRSNWNRNHIDSMLRNEQTQHELANKQLELIGELSKCASAVCCVEQAGSVAAEEQLRRSMQHWLQLYKQCQTSSAKISAVEEALVQMLNPEGNVNSCWLENMHGLLEDYTCKLQRELAEVEVAQQQSHDALLVQLKETQKLLEHMPRIYMRNILPETELEAESEKLMPLDIQLLAGHLRDAQRTLMNFFQGLLELRKDMLSCERCDLLTSQGLASWQQQLLELRHTCDYNVDEFFKSIEQFLQHAADGEAIAYETFTHTKGAVVNLHEQKRNAYGVSVWKKIRMKLEGRDPDCNQRTTVAEQVDYIIGEAINPDNLAVLYEGWTPWV
ncbi:nonC [Drosophila busckii]|uniref:non-specific serine/threonine protein kinase n=2 Tax=Drosophila busckii TaxID=30019 RepID=A0A0M4EVF0_DROBS|nr:nonC [Drosophila busckii]